MGDNIEAISEYLNAHPFTLLLEGKWYGMPKRVTMFLNTPPQFFGHWLEEHTQFAYMKVFPTEGGRISLDRARFGPSQAGTGFDASMSGVWLMGPTENVYLTEGLIEVRIESLATERVEITATCGQPVVMGYFFDLLRDITHRWPESLPALQEYAGAIALSVGIDTGPANRDEAPPATDATETETPQQEPTVRGTLGSQGGTLDRVREARELFEQGIAKTSACKRAHIDIRTYYRYAEDTIDWEGEDDDLP